MIYTWLQLVLTLLVILGSAYLLTNALEHLGHRLKISEGVTGSLFAAVATALPETMIPIIAILGGTANEALNHEVGVGAILGAPLMLSTLTVFLMTCAVLKSRGLQGRIRPEKQGYTRDLDFFLVAFLLAAVAMYIPENLYSLRVMIAISLVALYLFYILLTCRASKKLVASGHGIQAEDPLLFTKLKLKNNAFSISIQLIVAFALLILGAKGFITAIADISTTLQISALLLSLLIIPIATELPEKINSILWVRRGKDTLAVGNITGAMVFQGTLLPALGICLTPWQPNKEVIIGIVITLVAASWLRINAASSQGLAIPALLLTGVLYAGYLVLTLI